MGSKASDALAFSRGYSAGNYAAAYESEDIPLHDPADPDKISGSSESSGYVLGFFSTYELTEIPGDWIQIVTFLRAAYPDI